MDLHFTPVDPWPCLAWVARCCPSDRTVRVWHGRQVEVRPLWFCEAVWNRDFEAGDFDLTDLVFGSGARVRDDRVVFVSSGSTVDRLQHAEIDGKTWISNSLACLVAVSGVKVAKDYQRYPEFFQSARKGIDTYERRLPTWSGQIELTYFRNLSWNGVSLTVEDKPFPERDFDSFQKYRAFLATSLSHIAHNMEAADRSHPYQMIGSLSSGYDSPTATILAQEAGLEQAFSFRSGRLGRIDDGEEIARILGLELHFVDRLAWRQQALAEVPYFASTGYGSDVVLSSAQDILRGRVLVSGFHGGKVWAKHATALQPDIARGDASGLSFTEHRLSLGSIHLPVAFMGVRQIRDINILSNDSKLSPWEIAGRYSRPICRRIVEEAGVPRNLFGIRKIAVTNLFRRGEAVLTRRTQTEYYAWLEANELRNPRVLERAVIALQTRSYDPDKLSGALNKVLPANVSERATRLYVRAMQPLNRRINVCAHLFPWAVERMGRVYNVDVDVAS